MRQKTEAGKACEEAAQPGEKGWSRVRAPGKAGKCLCTKMEAWGLRSAPNKA